MANGKVDEMIDEIRARNERLMEEVTNKFHPNQAEIDRATLLAEVERLRKIHSGHDLEALLETYILLHKGKVTAHWLWVAIERIGGGETVAECLEDYGYAPLARAEAAERKLARLTVCPEEENGRHRWDETGQCWCCEQRAHILIYEATGEGK